MIRKLNNYLFSFSKVRFYNNKFDWAGDKWNVSVTIIPPTFVQEIDTVRLQKQSSMILTIFPL